MGRYIRKTRADGVIEDHLTQKPGRNLGLHRLADNEAIVEESISDVADQWDERCISLLSQERRAVGGRRSAVGGRRRAVT